MSHSLLNSLLLFNSPYASPVTPHPATQTQHNWLRIKKDNTQRGILNVFVSVSQGEFGLVFCYFTALSHLPWSRKPLK